MNWTELIHGATGYNYAVADALMTMVDDEELDWKPATGSNWMTTGQLLHHMAEACGSSIRGFVTGDWGIPEGAEPGEASEGTGMPPAESLPAVSSVSEARAMLQKDKALTLELLRSCSEETLNDTLSSAPWDKMEMPLGQRMLQMLEHLNQHKGQLYYYLKLQGKPVHTGNLWGV